MNVSEYAHYTQKAIRQLKGMGEDVAAARALWRLNHQTKSHYRNLIYRLKTPLIHHFYRSGYCIKSQLVEQKITCRACYGTGYPWGDIDQEFPECEDCLGTGIYRENTLYEFHFKIGGHNYCWHQPEQIVTYHVKLSDDSRGDYAEKPAIPMQDYTESDMRLDLMIVYWRLRWLGFGQEIAPELSISRVASNTIIHHRCYKQIEKYFRHRKMRK